MAQILINSRLCAGGKGRLSRHRHRHSVPESGYAAAVGGRFVTYRDDQRRRQAGLQNLDNVLRASILADSAGARKNTGDNTPAVIHTEVVPGDKLEIKFAVEVENKAKMVMLNPSDSIVDWVEAILPTMGAAGARPVCWVLV